MASRSTRSPRSRGHDDDFDPHGGLSAFLIRHRRLVGGVTAFAVAFSYVAANAIWYQPHAHDGAFFATRPAGQPQGAPASPRQGEMEVSGTETIIRLERETAQEAAPPAAPARTTTAAAPPPTPAPAPAAPSGDPMVEQVQRILAGLNLYPGEIDGLNGPQTRGAVEAYRKMVGLGASTEIDDQLLKQLGMAPAEIRQASAAPQEAAPAGTDMMATSSAPPRGDPTIMRIQAGLKAFGNEGIEIDGMVGPSTRAALREFQSLFGLPETGEPDAGVYAKMREIGLTD